MPPCQGGDGGSIPPYCSKLIIMPRRNTHSSIMGQSKAEYLKNFQRIRDIIAKSEGDLEMQKRLSEVQANRITDENKALNRAAAAKQIAGEHSPVFDVFFRRAYELGKVDKQEYRDYKLSKILDYDSKW